MAYTLIKGSFIIFNPGNPHNGPEPDGDTLKFKPDNKQLILNLPRPNLSANFNLAGQTSIRFEGIDALETHFSVEGDTFHQKIDTALKNRDFLLEKMGFGAITFFADKPFKVSSVEHHPVDGYILTNGLDTYGRTIAFVFVGAAPAMDGANIFVTPAMLDASLNAIMLKAGEAYGEFYLSLPAELREHLTAFVREARAANLGVWALDSVSVDKQADVPDLQSLSLLVVWPKLFRRLVAYFQNGFTNLDSLNTWLRADPINRDDRLILPNRELGNMHDIILVSGNNISLAYLPEDMVVVPDDYQLPVPFPVPIPVPQPSTKGVRIIAALVNPLGEDAGNETVTLINTTAAAIDLTGWQLADSTGKQALQQIIQPGEALRIALGNSVKLSNKTDSLKLVSPDGTITSQVKYDASMVPEDGETMLF